MGIEETFDIEIDNDEAEKIVTVGDAVEPVSYTHLRSRRIKVPLTSAEQQLLILQHMKRQMRISQSS